MQFIVKEDIKEERLTSIILEPNTDNMLKLFYCYNCRNGLFQYAGDVVMIVPGGVRTAIPVIVRCKNCVSKYLLASSM